MHGSTTVGVPAMIVCVCKAMSARALRVRIDAGARTLEELARATGVTTDCGTCLGTVLDLLEESGAGGAVENRTERGGSA